MAEISDPWRHTAFIVALTYGLNLVAVETTHSPERHYLTLENRNISSDSLVSSVTNHRQMGAVSFASNNARSAG